MQLGGIFDVKHQCEKNAMYMVVLMQIAGWKVKNKNKNKKVPLEMC